MIASHLLGLAQSVLHLSSAGVCVVVSSHHLESRFESPSPWGIRPSPLEILAFTAVLAHRTHMPHRGSASVPASKHAHFALLAAAVCPFLSSHTLTSLQHNRHCHNSSHLTAISFALAGTIDVHIDSHKGKINEAKVGCCQLRSVKAAVGLHQTQTSARRSIDRQQVLSRVVLLTSLRLSVQVFSDSLYPNLIDALAKVPLPALRISR